MNDLNWRYALVACLLGWCLMTFPAAGQYIVAHRGASHSAPENTLAAFHLAWEEGADGSEGDFHLTADGHIVCIHDRDTERVAGEKLVVAESSLAELQALDVGRWKHNRWQGERIPTLPDVLATVPRGKLMFIEVKCGPEIMEPLQRAIAGSGLPTEQLVLISFNEQVVRASKRLMPDMKAHWLTSYEELDSGEWQPSASQVVETLHRTRADGLGSKALLTVADEDFLETLRNGGFHEFSVWTVDEPAVARFYQQQGAWSIITNRPGWLRKQLELPLEAADD